ncbi:MAG: TonB-dependent receptor [Hyphomonadaceae bacterium]
MTLGWGRFTGLIAAACLTAGGGWAAAQEAEPPAQNAASNVTSYKPDFFTQFRPNTALDMIGRIPGFSFQGDSSGRGFSGTAGNVLIDGERPPSRGDSLSSIISRIPATGVERIDVIRGGAEGIDMQGQPIVANIIRKPDAGVTGSISSNINLTDEGKVSPNATLQMRNQADGQLLDGSITVTHSAGSGEATGQRINPAGVLIRQTETKSASTFDRVEATGAWETTWLGGKLRINGLVGADQFEGAGQDQLIVPGGVQVSRSASETLSGEAGIRYSRNFEGGYAMELVGFQSLWSGNIEGIFNTPTFTSGSRSDDETGESIARATLRLPAFGDWTFEGGGEIVYNYSESRGSRSLNGAPFVLDGDTNHVDELRTDGFSTATWSPSPKLNVELGARYEWSRITADVGSLYSQKELMFLKPRVNVSWTPEEGHQVGLRLERTVEQLDFGSFASQAAFEQQIFGVGNADAEPEKNWIFNARYERQGGGQNSFVISYTHTEIDDVLGRAVIVIPPSPPDPELELEITRNTGRATRDELEIKGSLELDGLGLSGGIFNVGATLRDSTITDPVTSEDHTISGISPWSWNVSLQQTMNNGDFRWGIFLQDDADTKSWSPRLYTEQHFGTFLGANVTWKLPDAWTISTGFNNLISENAETSSIFYTARRSVGVPQYFSSSISDARRTAFFQVRKNF